MAMVEGGREGGKDRDEGECRVKERRVVDEDYFLMVNCTKERERDEMRR